MKSKVIKTTAALAAAALVACGNTQVLDSWQDPDVSRAPVKRIVVVGLSGDDITRRLFENTFTKELKERGNDAVAGHTFLPKNAASNPDSALAALREAGFDAVLTARSLGILTEETVIEGTPYYIPDSGYLGWNGYYGAVYQEMTATTYTTRTEKARVETHVYDTATAKLVWAARSETTTSAKLTEDMKDYGRTVISELAKSGLIK